MVEILTRLRDINIPNPGVQFIRLSQFDDSFTRSDAQDQQGCKFNCPPTDYIGNINWHNIVEQIIYLRTEKYSFTLTHGIPVGYNLPHVYLPCFFMYSILLLLVDKLYSVPPLPIPDSLTIPKITECSNIQLCHSKLDSDTLLSIFASLLHERRILFYSTSLTFLTAVIHGMNQLLYPLHWQHIFIPVLPEDLIDYVCAPMPFICGVPQSLMEKIRKMPIDDIVIIDIDKSTIETPFKVNL